MLTLIIIFAIMSAWYMSGLIGAMWIDPDNLKDKGAYLFLAILALFGPLVLILGVGVKFFTFYASKNK